MRLLLNLLVGGLAVFVTSYVLPGVRVDSFMTAVIVAMILGVVNAFIRPLLVLLTLPGFWTALVFSVILSAIGWFLHTIA